MPKEISREMTKAEYRIEVLEAIKEMYNEADRYKSPRREWNERNWKCYDMEGDFSHKLEDQSKEFLPKNTLALDQSVSAIRQALITFDRFFDVEWIGEEEVEPLFASAEVKRLLALRFDECNAGASISECLRRGGNEVDSTIKIVWEEVPDVAYVAAEGDDAPLKVTKKRKKLTLQVLGYEEYFSDPWHKGLMRMYSIHRCTVPFFKLVQGVEAGLFDEEAVDRLGGYSQSEEDRRQEEAENQPRSAPHMERRHEVELWYFYGTVLSRDGRIMKDLDGSPLENVVAVIADRTEIIQMPRKNPRWAQCSPVVSAKLTQRENRALMDPGTSLNEAENEIFNLILDGGMSAVYGVGQVRMDWLAEPSQVNDGIFWGTKLKVNAQCPPGQKVYERVDTGGVAQESVQVFNLVDGIHAEAGRSNQIRQGRLPSKQVRSSEALIAERAIGGLFDAISKDFEDTFLEELIRQVWLDVLQQIKEFPKADLKRILGAEKFAELDGLSAAQVFARAASGYKFTPRAMSDIAQRNMALQNLNMFLSVLGTRPELLQEFSKTYSMDRLLKQLMHFLSLDTDKLTLTDGEKQARKEAELQMQQIMAMAQARAQAEKGGVRGSAKGAASPSSGEVFGGGRNEDTDAEAMT